jgi:hypothetical protein
LEPHFRLHLTHPLKTRAPRGRKSDFRDAQRLADRWSAGDLEESFIPGCEQRAWRWLTRTRVQLKKKLGVIYSPVEGLLEQGGIKLSAVVSDLFGVSGWAMLEQIARGVTDVEVLAGEARGVLRKKDRELQEALAGKEPFTGCCCGSTWIKCGCSGGRSKKSTKLWPRRCKNTSRRCIG